MVLKRVLYLGYLLTTFVISALVAPALKVMSSGFRYLSTLDIRAEQKLAGIVHSLKTSFGDRWRSAQSFVKEALTHEKFDGKQFKDVCSPSMLC